MLDTLLFVVEVVRRQVSIIHLQGPAINCYATLILIMLLKAVRPKLKIVYTVHDLVPHNGGKLLCALQMRIYKNVHVLIAHSQTIAVALAKISDAEIRRIPHGIYDRFKKSGSSSMACLPSEIDDLTNGQGKNLLFFGVVDRRKGLLEFMPILAEHVRNNPQTRLIVAGLFRLSPTEVDDHIMLNGLADHVRVVEGRLSDSEVGKLFDIADAAVLPYLKGETSGVAKIAIAYRLPIIATGVGEFPELVSRYRCGEIIDLTNSSESCLAIESALYGEVEYYDDESALNELSWNSIALRTACIWEQLCEC